MEEQNFCTNDIAIVWKRTWQELYEKYGRERVKEAARKTACGCPDCTKFFLENEDNKSKT